jgi:hypothetical protein
MSTDTTQTGVTDEIDQEIVDANTPDQEAQTTQEAAGGRQETDRERISREIAERRQAEMQGNESDYMDQAGQTPQVEKTVEAQRNEAPTERMVTIKVDGEERTVLESEVLEHGKRALQKESAADRRLKEAAEKLQAADARGAEVEAFARQLQAQQEQIQGKSLSNTDAAELRQQARGFMEKLLSGDEDAAVDQLTNLLGRGNATPDVSAMIEQATNAAKNEVKRADEARAQEEGNRLHAAAKTNFDRTFKEIVADPMLYRLTDQETMQVLADHPEWDARLDIDKIMTEAGERVRKWHGQNASASKQEMKRGLRKPSAGTSGRMPGAPEVKPLSASEVIAAQRRARGLPVY